MFFEKNDDKIVLRVRVSPNSSSCAIRGIFITAEDVEFLKIDLVSVPEKGKANKELIKFLSKKLGVAKSSFEVIFGELDRYKTLHIYVDVWDKLIEMEKEIR